MSIDQTDVDLLLVLNEQIANVEEQLSGLNADRANTEARLVEQFDLHGVQSMNVNGQTVYRKTNKHVSCKAECRQQLVEWAQKHGLAEMIVVQPARLKSWCKEQLEDVEIGGIRHRGELPAEVAELVTIYDKQSIRVRKS